SCLGFVVYTYKTLIRSIFTLRILPLSGNPPACPIASGRYRGCRYSAPHPFPNSRTSASCSESGCLCKACAVPDLAIAHSRGATRSEEHTSELEYSVKLV